MHSDVKMYLDEQKVETLTDAAVLADDCSLTHKVSNKAKPGSTGIKAHQSECSFEKLFYC